MGNEEDTQPTKEARAVAAKIAEQAERDAAKAKDRAKEKAAMDKAQEKIESANAKKERQQSVADAKRAHNEIKRLVKKEISAAKSNLKNMKEKAAKARAMELDEDKKVTAADQIAG